MSDGPNTKDWKATESTDFGGNDRKLRVSGLVEVGNLGSEPELARSETIPINETILMLDLTIRHGGGATVMNDKPVAYEEAISEGQYRQVQIVYEGALIETIDVEKIIS